MHDRLPSRVARASGLRALVIFGALLWLITESLSAFGELRRTPLILCWTAVLAMVLILKAGRGFVFTVSTPRIQLDPIVLICWLGVGAILTLTAITAAFSPPNSADAMAYHMPRVVYWAEQSSVRFFPTPYFNQIMLQPLAEYLMLHTYILSGGDHLINFVQWFASLASIVGVSWVAAELGADSRGQALAALFCATLPAGILASSGAKNDYFLAMWLIAAAYFVFRFTSTGQLTDALFLGGALGLALLTKATAYLFAPWLLAAIFLKAPRKHLIQGALIACLIAIAINCPQYARNYSLSGSILGFDSAQGDGFYRWRNESFGWRQTTSNVLRNLSDQLGARSSAWNQAVYRTVSEVHRQLGIDLNDPATTWRFSEYGPPVNANHEANAPNRWHLAILLAIMCVLAWRALHGSDFPRALYALGLVCAFVAFCAYLKWQPFFARLLLPLFVLGAPLASVMRTPILCVVCLFLLNNARPALFQNWVRPVQGPHNVLHTPRDTQYFSDMSQWNNEASYEQTVELLARSKCDMIGIDITDLQLEYPLQALLRERNPGVRFVHTGVQNVSSRYAQPTAAPPCAVVCLDCAGDAKRLALYDGFGSSTVIGKFVILAGLPSTAPVPAPNGAHIDDHRQN